jgi:valyl-tRNA synthetase
LAVHPDDPRYRKLVGKPAILPLTDRRLPIIADTYVDMEFGSGVVKVTPAHDPNDYEIGIRHNLARINILNTDGTLNSNVPEKYRGLTVMQARREVIKDLKDQGFFIKEEEYSHQVGHCYRCHTAIEPYLSDQWFVKMRPLADKALETWQQGNVNFFPRKWENTYAHWQKNIRDWCISRQLWWGHRIPVWYCNSCGEMTVSREDPDCCSACTSKDIRQDSDVLDTWFSSALWPFSTLGWPEKTKDLERFYPTSTLITGYDIIFFWVARMIMMGMEFMKETPFRDVYIHGLIRDKKGRKMSKSLGNGIDPLEVVEEYGADSLKFTISFLTAQGQDILMDKETFKLGSKFANKIWNASRFILMNLEGRELPDRRDLSCNQVDLWILHQLNEAAAETRKALDNYRFNDAAQVVYEYFWNDFCDWYIEAVKLSLYGDDEKEKNRAVTMLLLILEESLRLLHPFLPFITEEIYQKLPEELGKVANMDFSIVKAAFPEEKTERKKPEAVADFSLLQELVRAVRTLRSEFAISPEKDIKVTVRAEKGHSTLKVFSRERQLISLLINSHNLNISGEEPDRQGSIPVVGRGFEAFVYIKDVIDMDKELAKLQKEQAKVAGQIDRAGKKLANPTFLEKAPPEVIANEKNKLEELARRREKIEGYIKDLA